MRRLAGLMMPIVLPIILLAGGLLMPMAAEAHPHIWIQQLVRLIAKDGKYTHVEIEWRFDPFSSEIEIPPIDEDHDGKISTGEVKSLADDMLPELKKFGFMTWLNTGPNTGPGPGAKDFRPSTLPQFSAHIDDPASFKPPDWDRNAGDNGMPMPTNKRVDPSAPARQVARNLVYVMRFALPEPSKFVSITSYDPEDFVRIEVDKASVPAHCKLGKHPSYKAEFVRGYPVFADIVTCQLP
jgi:ABC-type uncharacterized transport system substrate-binding protein